MGGPDAAASHPHRRGAILLGTIPLAAVSGFLRIEQLYFVTLSVSVLTTFFDVAYQSYLPSLVGRAELLEGNSKLAASASIAEVSGFGAAGWLVQIFTAPIAIGIDAVSFAVSAISVGLIRTPEPPLESSPDAPNVWRVRLARDCGRLRTRRCSGPWPPARSSPTSSPACTARWLCSTWCGISVSHRQFLAFMLDPAVLLVMKLHVPRGAATPIVLGIAFAVMYLLGLLIWTQVTTLLEDFPTYTSRLVELIDRTNDRLDEIERQAIEIVVPKSLRQQEQQIQQKPQEAMKARRRRAGLPLPAPDPVPPQIQEVRVKPDQKPFIATIYGYVSPYMHVIVMASFVPFLVYFMLSWRDRLGDSMLRLFKGEKRGVAARSWTGIADSTRAYVLGNFLLWVFLSSASAITFFFLGVPYWALIGPLSGFLSLVPYAGLPLSMIPPVFASVAVPTKFKVVLTVVLFTAALHLLAMNFLDAKIIGRRVRLNPLVVTIALLFWGSVWGGAGLIFAIPITAGMKAVCGNVASLKGYGELLGD